MTGARAEDGARWLPAVVFGLFAWTCVEDETRKLLGAPLAVYLVKDILVAAAVVLSVRSASPQLLRQAMPPGLRTLLLWGGLLYVLGSFNPRLESYRIPLNGIHMTFFAVPMIVVGARFASLPRGVERLLWVVLGLSAAVACLGLVQAFVDPNFLNPLPDEVQADYWLVGIVRGEVPYVSGPFLSPGRYVTQLMNGGAAGLCLYFLSGRARDRALALAGSVLVGAGLVMSGARTGPFVVVLLFLGSMLAHEWRGRLSASGLDRPWRGRAIALVLTTVLAGGMAVVASERVAGTLDFYWESLFAEGGAGLRHHAEADLGLTEFDLSTWLFGNGTGAASFGIQHVFPDFVPVTEGGYSSVAWELGALGLTFYVLLAVAVCRVFLPGPRRANALSNALAPTFGTLVLIELWLLNATGYVLQQYVVSIPLWFFTGLAWRLRSTPPA